MLSELGQLEFARRLWDSEPDLAKFVSMDGAAFQLRPETHVLRTEVALEPVPSALPAMARLLEHAAAPGGAESRHLRLRENIAWWMDQRLWSENRVRELVVHDERHTQRVDLLAAQLVTPIIFQRNPRLTAADAEALSMAAWLHDWGHEGGEVSGEFSGCNIPLATAEPQVIRDLHGIVTRELLRDEWFGRHRLPPELASLVGILCAHHQGWTSFGGDRPTKQLTTTPPVVVQPPSLRADVQGHNKRFARARQRDRSEFASVRFKTAQLLLALLRIADGADMGVHRVQDAGPSKAAYLARAVQLQCRLTRTLISEADADPALREQALWAVARVSTLAEGVKAHPFGEADDEDPAVGIAGRMKGALAKLHGLAPIRRLHSYVSLASEQAEYYADHRSVANVWFETRLGRRGFDVTIWVSASEHARDESAAVKVVEADIVKELRRGDGQVGVADTLRSAGLNFMAVRSTDDPCVTLTSVGEV